MNIPPNFLFSQSNLQDFVDCRRRFQLKHLLHLAWPAVEAEPVLETERLIELGSRFHHLVHQFSLGIPLSKLNPLVQDEDLALWWGNFQAAISENGSLHNIWTPSVQHLPETTLSGQLGNVRLIAKMDLLAIHPNGNIQIFDWKTSQQVPRRTWLAERLQTKIYPYLLLQAGSIFVNGKAIKPEQVEMIYWYTSMPETPIYFSYTQQQFQSDQTYLHSLLDTLLRLDEKDFSMTNDERRCNYCVYRSLCNRGITAGQFSDYEPMSINDEIEFGFDFSQVDEIVF